ncbi:MAG: SLBB domain-containing protein [Acidobacteriaceae bacterium]
MKTTNNILPLLAVMLAAPFSASGQTPGAAQEAPCRGAACPASSNVPPPVVIREADTPESGPPAAAPAIRRPATPPTEFEELVESSVGKPLPIFGSELFQDVPSTFAPVDRIPVRAEYVLGPGDEVLVRAWGSIDLDVRVVVDRNGQVYLPKIGALNVSGLRYEQLAPFLKSAISSQFREFDLNVTMGQLRSIQIFMLGNVQKPGTYTVSSLSTLVNALFVSGGPSATGSMRSIQLKRAGKLVTDLDLYDLLVLGDKSKDAPLESGDVVYIPPIGPRIAVSGSVNNPAIFELRGPTTLEDALRFAGGLNNVAGSERILIEGIADRKQRDVAEFSLDQALTRPLRDGDVVRIFPVSPRFENAVTLRGAAAQPGRYPWHDGMRVSDLIPSREALISRNYWNNQNALVPDAQNLFGSPSPSVAPTDFRKNPAAINWDYAVVSRLNPANLKSDLLPFNLGQALSEPASPANLSLQPGDVVTVFLQTDIPVSAEKRSRYVRVEGEVSAPGVYQVQPDQTVRDVIAAAGGLTPGAYLYATDLRRESARLEQKDRLAVMVSHLEADIASRAASTDAHATPEEVDAQKSELAAQQQYLEKLSRVEPTGRVVLGVAPDARTVDALPPLPLEDQDVIRVPLRGGTVEVLGAVNNDSALIYRPGATVAEYLAQAGGPTRDADMRRIFVICADGSVVAGLDSHWKSTMKSMRLMPGDAVVVPNRLYNSSFLHGLRGWSQVFSQFALGVAAAKVLGE